MDKEGKIENVKCSPDNYWDKNEVIDFKLANSFSHSSYSHNVLIRRGGPNILKSKKIK